MRVLAERRTHRRLASTRVFTYHLQIQRVCDTQTRPVWDCQDGLPRKGQGWLKDGCLSGAANPSWQSQTGRVLGDVDPFWGTVFHGRLETLILIHA